MKKFSNKWTRAAIPALLLHCSSNPVINQGGHKVPNLGAEKDYITDIDAIAGATVTSAGYKEAIMAAFACVEILEGGNN